MTDAIIPPELIAEVDSAEPDFLVAADKTAIYWFELAHTAATTLGLTHLHEEHCLEPAADDPELTEKVAQSAEALLVAVQDWMKEHGVPRLTWWYYSVCLGDWLHATLKGTESGSFLDEENTDGEAGPSCS